MFVRASCSEQFATNREELATRARGCKSASALRSRSPVCARAIESHKKDWVASHGNGPGFATGCEQVASRKSQVRASARQRPTRPDGAQRQDARSAAVTTAANRLIARYIRQVKSLVTEVRVSDCNNAQSSCACSGCVHLRWLELWYERFFSPPRCPRWASRCSMLDARCMFHFASPFTQQ